MGVSIGELVSPYNKKITVKNLIGKVVAIDAFNWIYQFLSTMRGADGEPLKDYGGNVTSHISGLFYRSVSLMESGLKLVYVFDGKPNPLKANEIKRRKEVKLSLQKKWEEAVDGGDYKDAEKYSKGTSTLTPSMVDESKMLIRLLGLPVVESPQDGEAEASQLIVKNLAWACASQDYDAYLFGASRIIRNLSASASKSVDIEYCSLDSVLSGLNVTRSQLVDIGMLVGVDFFEGVRGIGEKTAYKLISEFKSVEGVIKNKRDKYNFDALTLDTVSSIRDIFLNPKYLDVDVKFKSYKRDDLIDFLVNRHNFSQDRVENQLNRLNNTSSRQTTFNDFIKISD